MDSARLARIPARMKQYVEQGTAAGFVSLVARHGHLASLEAVGYQDREAKIPMRTDSIFRIKSLTKPITVAGVMILVDEARISLLDPVEQYLPEYHGIQVNPCGVKRQAAGCDPVKPSRLITVRDLMTHTAGIADNTAKPATPVATLADRVRTGLPATLFAEPGAVWRYSNTGFASLGRLIEVVSGEPYDLFMEKRLFQPLGMTDTHFVLPAGKQSRLAAVYTLDSSNHLNRTAEQTANPPVRFPGPEGGLFSTATDQARFYQMLLDKGTIDGHRILSIPAVEAMTTNQTGDLKGAEFSPGLGMGLGFGVVKEALGTFRYQSVGTFMKGGAFRTFGFGDPARDLVGVLMFQRTNGGGDVAEEITAFVTLAEAAVER